MDSTLMLEHITACQGRNEDAFNFSLHLSKAQVDREQQYRDGHWHARHLEDATNAKRKFKDVLGHKVFCYWIPLPASYRSYGWWFDHIPPVKRILVSWSSWTSASLDYDQDLLLCWTSHEISTHYSRSLQLSRREKSHHPNWLCQLHKKRRFASTFPGVSSLPKQRRRTPLLHLPFKTDTSLLSTKGSWKCKCKMPIHRLLGKVSAEVDDS